MEEEKEPYNLENGDPSSLAIAHKSRLPEVMHPAVPLMKQTARAQLSTTAAARLPVARYIISVMGTFVLVLRIALTSTRPYSITRINKVPVVPPMPTAATMACGASRCGLFISSVMWATWRVIRPGEPKVLITITYRIPTNQGKGRLQKA